MEIKRYQELKGRGVTKMQKVSKTVVLITQTWDYGQQGADVIISIDKESVEKQRDEAQATLDGLNSFLADVATEEAK